MAKQSGRAATRAVRGGASPAKRKAPRAEKPKSRPEPRPVAPRTPNGRARVSSHPTSTTSPLARSTPSVRPPPRIPTPPPLVPRSMELEWSGDPGGSSPPEEPAFDRWVARGDLLLRKLAEHGAANHEYRTDLREGRFYWVDPDGRVSAQAKARLVCTFVPSTSSVAMGWADPMWRTVAISRLDGMPAELDNMDEEGAWRVAMAAADRAGADFLYRVRAGTVSLFLCLNGLSFAHDLKAFVPHTPVPFVRALLAESIHAVALGAEPADTLRARIAGAGTALVELSAYAYRATDWVSRLTRSGKRLLSLAEKLPRPTFFSVAKGTSAVWLDPREAGDLKDSLTLLDEEWRQFGG